MDCTKSFDEYQDKHNKHVPSIFTVLSPPLLLSLLLVFAVVMGSIAPSALATKLATAKRPVKPASTATATTPQSGDSIVFYGPRQFTRASGSPVTVTEQFSVPFGVVAPYTINVLNGAADGSHRVSSASIQLNGVELFTQ